MFTKFKVEAVRDMWKNLYCTREEGSNCARKQLRDQGKTPAEVPLTLLPNGLHLADIADTQYSWEQRTGEVCKQLESCTPMFNRFRDPESRDFWAQRYCFVTQGNKCTRHKLLEEGTAASSLSPGLLPNGDKI
jgi:hypothetical protein